MGTLASKKLNNISIFERVIQFLNVFKESFPYNYRGLTN